MSSEGFDVVMTISSIELIITCHCSTITCTNYSHILKYTITI